MSCCRITGSRKPDLDTLDCACSQYGFTACLHKFVYASVSEARTKIAGYLDWYNKDRAHSSIEDQTPDEAYWAGLPQLKEAA